MHCRPTVVISNAEIVTFNMVLNKIKKWIFNAHIVNDKLNQMRGQLPVQKESGRH
jgi:hypothetical protein